MPEPRNCQEKEQRLLSKQESEDQAKRGMRTSRKMGHDREQVLEGREV